MPACPLPLHQPVKPFEGGHAVMRDAHVDDFRGTDHGSCFARSMRCPKKLTSHDIFFTISHHEKRYQHRSAHDHYHERKIRLNAHINGPPPPWASHHRIYGHPPILPPFHP